jgi:hypothetical protein
MMIGKGAALFLLVLAMSAPQARAQNQTPANIAPAGWTDPDTGLTWTKADNGSDINWNEANDYCSNLRLGGFSDWRLPTLNELRGIYDESVDTGGWHFHVKGNLKLSSVWQWSSDKDSAGVWGLYFNTGTQYPARSDYTNNARALCVRR